MYGRKPVESQLERDPARVEKIWVRQGLPPQALARIRELGSQHRIPVQEVPGKKLADLVGPVNDQGVVAQLSAATYTDFADWLPTVDTSTLPVVLVLDGIEDVANFGAILRTAAGAGAAAVLVPKHGQAPVNATVMKTSAGTAGLVPIVRVTNLNSSIRDLKDAGFWVCGLDQRAPDLAWHKDLRMALAIVVGGEGSGMHQKTRELCDFLVRFPMAHGIESLNAGVSAALLAYEALRQRQS